MHNREPPNPRQPDLPPAFKARMLGLLGTAGFEKFAAAHSHPTHTSIRINHSKASEFASGKFGNAEQVGWCSSGKYLANRPVFALDPIWHAGGYYVQEASSMLPGLFVQQWLGHSDWELENRPLRVLDMCAAPGGKSTLLASVLPPGAVLVSNEVIANRASILRENLTKWAFPGSILTSSDPDAFAAHLPGFFDVVLVDAPCSGEGLWRKQPEAMAEWSPGHVAFCAGRQKRIVRGASALVRPGGLLVYCTCTFSEAENEEVLRWLAIEQPQTWQPLPLANYPANWGFTETAAAEGWPCYRCYPHLTKGEGFFVGAAIKAETGKLPTYPLKRFNPKNLVHKDLKPFASLPANWTLQLKQHMLIACSESVMQVLAVFGKALKVLQAGVLLGEAKGKDIVPAHDLALSPLLSADTPRHESDLPTALAYLKGEALMEVPRGWQIVEYEGLPLGWIKGVGSRSNNHYPKSWRLRLGIGEQVANRHA